jgi:hypothetical protein
LSLVEIGYTFEQVWHYMTPRSARALIEDLSVVYPRPYDKARMAANPDGKM